MSRKKMAQAMPRGGQRKSQRSQFVHGHFRQDRGAPPRLPVETSVRLTADDTPAYLRGQARDLFISVADQCDWFVQVDAVMLGVWATLATEFHRAPAKMMTSRVSLLKGLSSELGLLPRARDSLGLVSGVSLEQIDPEEKEFFYDDV